MAGIKETTAQETAALRRQLDDANEEIRRLEADAKNLRVMLDYQQAARGPGSLTELRPAFADAINGSATLEDMLRLIEAFFPERVVILDSAWKSARNAEAFRHRREAFDLTLRLVTTYYDTLAAGGIGDGAAAQIFGHSNFSARESRSTHENRKAQGARSFEYKGEMIDMIRHLRFGIKDNIYDTFRLHFHWDGEDKKIVIGHCGAHLDQR